MSKKSLVILAVVIIVLIGICVWYTSSPTQVPTNTKNVQVQNNVAVPITTANDTNQSTMSASTNTSDAAINQDLGAIDAQLKGLNTDSANINSSLNQ